MTKVSVPETLHDLMRMALDDVKKISKDKRYEVDMSEWHMQNDGEDTTPNACCVCMAGAIMACHLGAEPGLDYFPEDFDHVGWYGPLQAINEIRGGHFFAARRFLEMGDGSDHSIVLDDEQALVAAQEFYFSVAKAYNREGSRSFASFPAFEHEHKAWFEAWDSVIDKLKELKL